MDKALVSTKDYVVNFIKALFSGLCLSLILILIFAFVLKFVSVSDGTIKIVNQVIKIVSILYAMLVLRKKDKNSLFFKGILLGALYGLFAYLIFSILSGSFAFNLTNFNDIAFNAVIGAVIGLFLGLLNRRAVA